MSDTCLAGILTVADIINANGRSYPLSVLKLEVQRFHREHVLTGTAFGDLDHPQYFSTSYSVVDPARASHQILALWWKGCELHGVVKLMSTETAQKARDILQNSGRLGASTRCWSSLAADSSGLFNVHTDCKLITFDLTEQPATGCFLAPLAAHIPHVIHSLKETQSTDVSQQHGELPL